MGILTTGRRLLPPRLAVGTLPALLLAVAGAHPVPDIPVRAAFAEDGTVTIRVEVDPRCFADDPLNEPYLENAAFQELPDRQKRELVSHALRLVAEAIDFRFSPEGVVAPRFRARFTTFGNQPLEWNEAVAAAAAAAAGDGDGADSDAGPVSVGDADDGGEESGNAPDAATPESCAVSPVMITLEWKGDARELESYRVAAAQSGRFSVQVITGLDGVSQPHFVLFPGEASEPVDLAEWKAGLPPEPASAAGPRD